VMIRCLTECRVIEVDSRARSHMTAISKFEQFLAANCNQPVYLGEMYAATGVSETTLHRCCHEHLGMGPVRYLRLRRMSLVRAALLRADPANATVTDIATDHGFWELGRFAVEYRALFGESPSASLRRPTGGLHKIVLLLSPWRNLHSLKPGRPRHCALVRWADSPDHKAGSFEHARR